VALLAVLWPGCGASDATNRPPAQRAATTGPTVTRASFGSLPDGTGIDAVTLANGRVEVRVITYGGIIVSLRVPDRAGRLDALDGYLKSSPYFGAITGRYANRIAGGRFALEGKTYQLAVNDGPNHLHGGVRGFDKVVWAAETFREPAVAGVRFSRTSPAGEEGYPGNVAVQVSYTLTDHDRLVIDYHATTDAATPINLTHHSYFNLTGGARDILGHELTIEAERFTPVDTMLIPTGELRPVEGTPFDFRRPAAIGARIADDEVQLRHGRGYDHNFVLRRPRGGLVRAARVVEPATGRTLELSTTEPGLQFYSGNFLDGSITGKSGVVYRHRYGFCLEPQHFPDSPNKPQFPSAVLRPGDVYRSQTVFAFGVLK
jgi:aldose 1-epimerase